MKKVRYTKKLYEELQGEFSRTNVAYQEALKEKDRLHKEELERRNKKAEEVTKIFDKTLASALPLFINDSFSEGYLASDLKYELKVSRIMKRSELGTLIKKLQFDLTLLEE